MKWRHKCTCHKETGRYRTRRIFAWRPIHSRDYTYWLEWVFVQEEATTKFPTGKRCYIHGEPIVRWQFDQVKEDW